MIVVYRVSGNLRITACKSSKVTSSSDLRSSATVRYSRRCSQLPPTLNKPILRPLAAQHDAGLHFVLRLLKLLGRHAFGFGLAVNGVEPSKVFIQRDQAHSTATCRTSRRPDTRSDRGSRFPQVRDRQAPSTSGCPNRRRRSWPAVLPRSGRRLPTPARRPSCSTYCCVALGRCTSSNAVWTRRPRTNRCALLRIPVAAACGHLLDQGIEIHFAGRGHEHVVGGVSRCEVVAHLLGREIAHRSGSCPARSWPADARPGAAA